MKNQELLSKTDIFCDQPHSRLEEPRDLPEHPPHHFSPHQHFNRREECHEDAIAGTATDLVFAPYSGQPYASALCIEGPPKKGRAMINSSLAFDFFIDLVNAPIINAFSKNTAGRVASLA